MKWLVGKRDELKRHTCKPRMIYESSDWSLRLKSATFWVIESQAARCYSVYPRSHHYNESMRLRGQPVNVGQRKWWWLSKLFKRFGTDSYTKYKIRMWREGEISNTKIKLKITRGEEQIKTKRYKQELSIKSTQHRCRVCGVGPAEMASWYSSRTIPDLDRQRSIPFDKFPSVCNFLSQR